MNVDRFLSRDAQNLKPNAIRAFAKLINDPKIISFAGGTPSAETFPAARLAEIAERLIRERGSIALQYGPTRGLARLCAFVASLCRQRGFQASADDIIMTTGSQQALDLAAHVLIDPGDVVLVELPSYIGGLSSFYGRSAKLEGVAQDDGGIVIESLEEAARNYLRRRSTRSQTFRTLRAG